MREIQHISCGAGEKEACINCIRTKKYGKRRKNGSFKIMQNYCVIKERMTSKTSKCEGFMREYPF